jgi:hypothetical protein
MTVVRGVGFVCDLNQLMLGFCAAARVLWVLGVIPSGFQVETTGWPSHISSLWLPGWGEGQENSVPSH